MWIVDVNIVTRSLKGKFIYVSLSVKSIVVKDRLGDQDKGISSGSSESESDEDSEVVSGSLTLITVSCIQALCYRSFMSSNSSENAEFISRNLILNSNRISTEHSLCSRRKTQRSIRQMQNSTQKRVCEAIVMQSV